MPAAGATPRSPAAGGIQVSAIRASSQTAAPGQPVLLSVDITGENVGYVKLLVGYLDQAANSINVADEDYLESSETREVRRRLLPGLAARAGSPWSSSGSRSSSPSTTAASACRPCSCRETYGKSFEDAIYTVDGTYTYADDGASRTARLYFRNGALQQVFGFTGDGTTGAPREIVPQPGDTFTVLEQWLDVARERQGVDAGDCRKAPLSPSATSLSPGSTSTPPRAPTSSASSSRTWTASSTRCTRRSRCSNGLASAGVAQDGRSPGDRPPIATQGNARRAVGREHPAYAAAALAAMLSRANDDLHGLGSRQTRACCLTRGKQALRC